MRDRTSSSISSKFLTDIGRNLCARPPRAPYCSRAKISRSSAAALGLCARPSVDRGDGTGAKP